MIPLSVQLKKDETKYMIKTGWNSVYNEVPQWLHILTQHWKQMSFQFSTSTVDLPPATTEPEVLEMNKEN